MNEDEEEHFIDIELNDICEYLDIPVCCHPDHYENGEVTEDFCLKCSYRKIPIKGKAIKLLTELYRDSSNVGYLLEPYLDTHDDDDFEKQKETEILDNLSETLSEVDKFLKSVGVVIKDEKD